MYFFQGRLNDVGTLCYNNFMKIKQFLAGRAFIKYKDKILIIREAQTYEGGTNIGKYDTPGGKIQPGESYQDGLKREVLEECGLKIEVGSPFYICEWRPEINNKTSQIIGIFSECFVSSFDVALGADHDDFQWILPEDYKDFPIIESSSPAFESYLQLSENK